MTFPTTLDEATKATIFDWFQYREVCDDDKFNTFFNRTLVRDLPQYEQLLRIEPGVAEYDWLVEEYLESQRTHTGSNSDTLSGNVTTDRSGTVTTEGTGKSVTNATSSETATDTDSTNETIDATSTLTKTGTESNREYSNQNKEIGPENQTGNLTVDYESYDGNLTAREYFATGKNTTSDTLTKDGSYKTERKSGSGDGSVVTIVKNGTETHDIDDSKTASHEIEKNGSRQIDKNAEPASNYDENSGGITTTKDFVTSEETTTTPGVTDTVKTWNNQISATDTKNLTKTLPMSTAGGDFSTSAAYAPSAAANTAGTNIPAFAWSDASGMSEQISSTAYSGDPNEQETSHTGSDKVVVSRFEGASDDNGVTHNTASKTSDTTKTSHSVDSTEKETFTNYKETDTTTEDTLNHTDSLTFTNREDKNTTVNTLNQSDTTTFDGYSEKRTTIDEREKVNETEYPTKKTNAHYEVYDNQKDLTFKDRIDTSSEVKTSTSETTRNSNSTGSNDTTTNTDSSNTVTNALKDATLRNETSVGTNSYTDTEQHTGRHGNPAAILAQASEFIKGSSAWSWLEIRLEPCFLGIYDV